MTQPSRLTFFRCVLAVTSLLAWLSLREAFNLAEKLGIAPLASKTWLALLGALALTGALSLLLFVLSFMLPAVTSGKGIRLYGRFSLRTDALSAKQISAIFGGNEHKLQIPAWISYPLLLAALAAYPLIMFHPYYGELLAKQTGIRLFLFWIFSLAGAQFLIAALNLQSRLKQKSKIENPYTVGLLITILLQASIQRVLLYLPDISAYPFAMGWSETSRFYYPALFMSRAIFGQSFAWPILHPTLHFALTPPYLLDIVRMFLAEKASVLAEKASVLADWYPLPAIPLWFHRFWQVAVRLLLVGLIAPALISRLNIPNSRGLRWLSGLWIFLTLFTLPLYLHLAVPVFIMLWGFSVSKPRSAWFWLIIASIWAGLSRLNWYPMPGILAAALYFLEVPAPSGKKSWSYLLKPALWFVVSTAIAFLSMQIYISLSGIPNPGNFYTSLSSTKLWERLWPNESYALGVFPGIVIFSAPFWLLLFSRFRSRNAHWESPGYSTGSGSNPFSVFRLPLPSFFLLMALLILFAGGIVVSTKIGGGADIHNMDAYAVLLLIISAYRLFGPRPARAVTGAYPAGDAKAACKSPGYPDLHWGIAALLVLVPAWFSVLSTTSFWQYNPVSSQATLTALQREVDRVNSQGGEILFITQRHLISMHMLKGVTLIPEYEREELMEMSMAQNDAYLQTFRADIQKHRFAAIVVDPLRNNFVGDQDSMGAENNAWTRYVVKKILCSYQQAAIFPADRIAIYTPQVGEQKCP